MVLQTLALLGIAAIIATLIESLDLFKVYLVLDRLVILLARLELFPKPTKIILHLHSLFGDNLLIMILYMSRLV